MGLRRNLTQSSLLETTDEATAAEIATDAVLDPQAIEVNVHPVAMAK